MGSGVLTSGDGGKSWTASYRDNLQDGEAQPKHAQPL